EVNQYNRSSSTLFSVYKNIEDEKFRYYILKNKKDVFNCLKAFFLKEN
ncbi:sporulation protein YhbH, partial [Bacillus wiedmannii]